MKDALNQLIRLPNMEGAETIKKRIHPVVIWMIVAAIVFLAMSSFAGDDDEPRETGVETSFISAEEYVQSLEKRLKETLQKINGAGTVSVFISIEGGGEKILATDRIYKTQEESETVKEAEEERKVVLQGKSTQENPYVVEERFPEPVGVLVVAEGAKNETVRYEIYQAVRSLFGLPAHRIQISY